MDAVANDDEASSSSKPRRLRILVVEDDEDSRELMTELLRQMGEHAITAVGTAGDGLQHLRREAFDLIVTDIGLPDFSGLEMLDQATREGLLPGPEVVVCSANAWLRPQVVQRGVRYIPKPADVAQVRDAVRATPTRDFPPAPPPHPPKDDVDPNPNGEGARMTSDFEHRISGYDFVRAMFLAGYRLVGSRMGESILVNGEIELMVPQCNALTEETTLALLKKAKIPPLQMLTLLNRLGSRDTWPEQGEVLRVARDKSSP